MTAEEKKERESGLYLVSTPIGNLEDITLRALRILRQADLIAAEDTRQSRKLLNHFDIAKPLVSYHEHNKQRAEGQLLAALREGALVALISDAGTPGISDPGADLVRAALDAGLPVHAAPGASALLSALVVSGLDCRRFAFEGFLPRLAKERRALLANLAAEERTLVFYEAPHRLLATLADIDELLGPRQLVLARELTKRYEECIRGNAARCLAHFAQQEPRGEFTLLVAGAGPSCEEIPTEEELRGQMARLMREGQSRKAAAKDLAVRYGLPAKKLYDLSLGTPAEN